MVLYGINGSYGKSTLPTTFTKATLHQFEEGMYVLFQEPQSAITAEQFAAWYIEDELVQELFLRLVL
jgi:tRNA U34 2-thiouridine synthase MnmA/TrmU